MAAYSAGDWSLKATNGPNRVESSRATPKFISAWKDENRLDPNLLISFISVLCCLSLRPCLWLSNSPLEPPPPWIHMQPLLYLHCDPGQGQALGRVWEHCCLPPPFITWIRVRFGNCGSIEFRDLSIAGSQVVAKQIRPNGIMPRFHPHTRHKSTQLSAIYDWLVGQSVSVVIDNSETRSLFATSPMNNAWEGSVFSN